jgi:VWFA-related protein
MQAQQVFHSDTRLVEVQVVVRDSKGPVAGLTRDDFRLLDNDKPEKIATFSVTSRSSASPGLGGSAASDASVVSEHKTEPPVSATVIYINVLAIPFSDQVQAKQRIAEVLRTLPPQAPIAVYVRNFTLRLMTDFTDDPKRIASALAESWGELPQPPCAICNPPPALLDLEEIANQLAGLPGRKNVLWLANFFPVGSEKDDPIALYQTTRTIRALNAANVAVFPITAEGVAGPGAYSADRSRGPGRWRNPSAPGSHDGAKSWAESTGGVPAFNTDVGMAAQRALEYNEVTYNLGFYPETADGRYHHLKVTVARKGAEVSSRQGYLAIASDSPFTSLTTGMDLAARAALPGGGVSAAAIDATMQLPYFYTGTDRARVHLALDFTPRGMAFQTVDGKQHGRIDFIGTTSRADGEAVARFTESDNVDRETQAEASAFTQAAHRFEHQFLLASGNYLFQMTIGAGPAAVRKIELPLTIGPWKSTSFGMGDIAFTTEASTEDRASSAGGGRPLIAAGREFVPLAANHFGQDGHVYFYTEIYDPKLKGANPPALSLQYSVIDRASGEVKRDTGMAGVAGYVHSGDPTVPFATALPISELGRGAYRLEVRATHSADGQTLSRSVDFDVN